MSVDREWMTGTTVQKVVDCILYNTAQQYKLQGRSKHLETGPDIIELSPTLT